MKHQQNPRLSPEDRVFVHRPSTNKMTAETSSSRSKLHKHAGYPQERQTERHEAPQPLGVSSTHQNRTTGQNETKTDHLDSICPLEWREAHLLPDPERSCIHSSHPWGRVSTAGCPEEGLQDQTGPQCPLQREDRRRETG